jgi:hypothetical protein
MHEPMPDVPDATATALRRRAHRARHPIASKRCPVCGHGFVPSYHAALTCGRVCGRILRAQRAERRALIDQDAALPDHTDGAPYCPTCREPFTHTTDFGGRLLQTCRCGTRPVSQQPPPTFHRYAASAQRLRDLGRLLGGIEALA